MTSESPRSQLKWKSFTSNGLVLYDFHSNALPKLALQAGQRVRIVERYGDGWFRGCVESWSGEVGTLGIFPCSFILLDKDKQMHSSDPIISDLVLTLRNWGEVYRREFVSGNQDRARRIVEQLSTLLSMYHKICDPSFNDNIRQQLKEKIPGRLDRARLNLGFALTVKTESGEEATHFNTPFHQLFRMHAKLDSATTSSKTDSKSSLSQARLANALSSSLKNSMSSAGTLRRTGRNVGSTIRNLASSMDEGVGGRPQSGDFSSASKSDEKAPYCLLIVRFPLLTVPMLGDPGRLHVSIYSKKLKRFLTEDVVVETNAVGNSKSEPVIAFCSIYTRELNADLHLVVRVVRHGNILPGSKKESLAARRLFAVGAHPLSLRDLQEKESSFTPKLYSFTASGVRKAEDGWMSLFDMVMSGDTHTLQEVQCSLSASSSTRFSPVEEFVADFRQRHRTLGVTVAKRLGFMPEFLLQSDSVRNDLYLWVEECDMPERKARNIEVSVVVIDVRGNQLPGCLLYGSGGTKSPTWESCVVYHNNTPSWHEPLIVSLSDIDPSLWQGLAAVFLMRHKPTGQLSAQPPFAYAMMQLSHLNGPFLMDQGHEVRCGKARGDLMEYSSLSPTVTKDKQAGTLRVRSLLVSTRVTNVEPVFEALRWRSKKDQADRLAQQLGRIEKLELKKFFNQVFDVVIEIACDDSLGPQCKMAACESIVSILANMLDDRVGTGDRELLDEYLSGARKKLAEEQVPLWRRLSDYLLQLCLNPAPKPTMLLMKAFEYVLRLMIYSFERDEAGQRDPEEFNERCVKVLLDVFSLAASSDAQLYAAQVVMLKNMGMWLIVMEELFDPATCADLVISFLKMIPYDAQKKNKNVAKLALGLETLEVLRGDIMREGLMMGNFLPELLKMLPQHFRSTDDGELDAASKLLSEVLMLVGTSTEGDWDLLSLVHSLHPLRHRKDCATNLCQIFWSTTSVTMVHFDATLALLEDWADNNPFPSSWFSMNMFFLSAVVHVCSALSRQCPTASSTDVGRFLSLTLRFRAHPTLDLSQYIGSKRNFVLANYGDLRVRLGNVWTDTYTSLAPAAKQALLIDGESHLIKNIFLLLLRTGEKQWAMRAYFTLLDDEYKHTKELHGTESQTMDAFSAISSEPNAAQFQEEFFRELKEKLSGHSAPTARRDEFLDGLQRLLKLQQQLRELPDLPPFEHERANAMLNIMAFLKRLGKTDIYRALLQDLCNLHKKLGAHLEAANALMLASSLIEWDGQRQDGPKERTMLDAVNLFAQGGFFEKSCEVLGELQERYEAAYFDFPRLAKLYSHEADLVGRLATDSSRQQFCVNYFRVAYFGGGWDEELRDTAYIFKGNPLEQLPVFRDRLLSRFSEAKVLDHTDEPADDVRNSADDKYLQVFTVAPEGNAATAPSNKFLANACVSTFTYKKPFKKTKTGNPFRDLWSMVRYYHVEKAFPTIVRRCKVERVEVIEVSPIENAVEAMEQKNHELRALCDKYSSPSRPSDINPITQGIQGVVQAFVNGGTDEYINVFFKDASYLKENPTHKPLVIKLKHLLNEQDEILKQALGVYSRVVTPDFRPLQVEFEKTFADMQARPKDWQDMVQ